MTTWSYWFDLASSRDIKSVFLRYVLFLFTVVPMLCTCTCTRALCTYVHKAHMYKYMHFMYMYIYTNTWGPLRYLNVILSLYIVIFIFVWTNIVDYFPTNIAIYLSNILLLCVKFRRQYWIGEGWQYIHWWATLEKLFCLIIVYWKLLKS